MVGLGMDCQEALSIMDDADYLFDIENLPSKEAEQRFNAIDIPLWTKNKALFIARYMKTFVFITKHGTYIDAFAGPQDEDSRDASWSAKLVLENEPAWLKNFYLFDEAPEQVRHLEALKEFYFESNAAHVGKRKITVTEGDSNLTLPRFLEEHPIKDTEATFCLLDQRSTECSWDTVKAVADHKRRPDVNKIEIFYFFAQGWIDRTIKSWTIDPEERRRRWWGREDVMDFLKLKSPQRSQCLATRFKEELGYRYAHAFPIQKEGERGTVMFWMIHASDHERAPSLMFSAYRHVGAGGGLNDPIEQFEMDL